MNFDNIYEKTDDILHEKTAGGRESFSIENNVCYSVPPATRLTESRKKDGTRRLAPCVKHFVLITA